MFSRVFGNSFSWLGEYSRPLLVSGNNVTILSTPGEYLQWLKSQVDSAQLRIRLSSLYFGTGELEKELVLLIGSSLRSKPSLQCSIILDCLRGHRGNPNSLSVLGTLIRDFPHQFSLYMYHTPSLRGLLKWGLPGRINEVVGLQHTKIHVFDDDVLLTGANLSHDYFTNRQDRYISFSSSPSLANYLSQVHETISRHSFLVRTDSSLENPQATLTFNPLHSHSNAELYKSLFYNDMEGLLKPETQTIRTQSHTPRTHSRTTGTQSNTDSLHGVNGRSHDSFHSRTSVTGTDFESTGMESEECDTIVYPLIQMGEYGIRQDEVVTQHLLANVDVDERLYLASGYFNLPDIYKTALLKSKGIITVLASSPQCMGFYGAKGPAGAIPHLYSNLAAQFLKESFAHSKRISYMEYYKPNWTYHAKGIWYYLKGMTLPSLTLIGSSNYGYRSLRRDLELQVAMITHNRALQLALNKEMQLLYDEGTRLSLEELRLSRDHRPPLWVRGVTPLLKYHV